jgi:predicted O-methyltransferase YrrM
MLTIKDVYDLAKVKTDIQEHLITLYNIAISIDAKMIVELGAGYSTYALTAAANANNGELCSIDILPGGRDTLINLPAFANNQEPRMRFVAGDSVEVGKAWGRMIDFLFIDSAHTYDATYKELMIWLPYVKQGGIIAMHDTLKKPGPNQGCRQALDVFLLEHPNQYEVNHYENCNGLSILKKL